jgi:hypothetical protein
MWRAVVTPGTGETFGGALRILRDNELDSVPLGIISPAQAAPGDPLRESLI